MNLTAKTSTGGLVHVITQKDQDSEQAEKATNEFGWEADLCNLTNFIIYFLLHKGGV